MIRLTTTTTICFIVSFQSIAQRFHDPKPPAVNELEPILSPEPVSQPELTFHQPPKPISKRAITEDWMDFMGF